VPLSSLRRYTVEVRVSTDRSEDIAHTEFTTGVLRTEDWHGAAWITANASEADPAPVLRCVVPPTGGNCRWLLAVAVAGCATIHINGVELADQLIGGITDFTKRVQYTVLDVSSTMKSSEPSEVVIQLGNAFYGMTSANTWNWETAPWHAVPSVKAILVREDMAGDPARAGFYPSDASWQAASGRTTYNDYFGGETFDARRNLEWHPVCIVDGPAGRLENARQPPIRVMSGLEFVGVRAVGPTWVLDFGRVIAGWVNLAFCGTPGQELVFRYGEKLRDDGLPNNDDPVPYFAGRFQEDVYVAHGTGPVERWHPQFSWKGFRYLSVDGWSDSPPTRDEISASRVHTAVSRDGQFHSSSALLNGIHRITIETMLNNLHGIPTDTPMYEKNGWTGDGMVAADMFLLNFGAASLLDKWVDDIIDTTGTDGTPAVIAPNGGWTMDWEPCPTWHSALVLIPWSLYVSSGDPRVLERTFPAIDRYVSSEFRRSHTGIADTTLGDWLSPEASPGGGNPEEDLRIAATAYLYAQCTTAAQIAHVLGRDNDEERFAGFASTVRTAFLEMFFDEGLGWLTSPDDRGFRQAHQVLGVGLGLLTGERRRRALAATVDDIRRRGNHLNTGMLATKYLLPVLSDHGHHDVAMDIALQTTYPSWGYWLECGATTTWEHWDPASQIGRAHV
jgi:alpha-L-rhamnosidase